MSTIEEQSQGGFASQAPSIPVQAIVAPPPVLAGDPGFNLEAEIDATPAAEVGVIKVHVRDVNGRTRYFTRNGDRVPVTVTIHNSYTDLAQRVDAHMRRDKVRGNLTYDTLYKRQIFKLSRCTTGWDGIVDGEGNPVPFSRALVERLYQNNPYLRKDALDAMEDDSAEDFFAK